MINNVNGICTLHWISSNKTTKKGAKLKNYDAEIVEEKIVNGNPLYFGNMVFSRASNKKNNTHTQTVVSMLESL